MPWPACHNLIVTKPWPWVWIYLSQNKYFSGCIVFLLNQEWVFFLPLTMFLSISFVLESPSFINLWHLFHNVDLSNDQKVLSVHMAPILVLVESSHLVKTAEFIYCHGVPSLWSYFFQELLQAFPPCASSCRGTHNPYGMARIWGEGHDSLLRFCTFQLSVRREHSFVSVYTALSVKTVWNWL